MSGSTPKISVVVPSYNHARFVVDAVCSALDQHHHDLEVVVVDDGSRDDSVARLRALDDPRLRIVEQANAGAHNAFARGLGLARGELIFLLNSDDLYAPDRFDRFVERFAAEPDLVALTSWIEIIDDTGRSMGIKHAWHDMPPWPAPRPGECLGDLAAAHDEPALALLASNWVSTTSNLAYRRTTVEAAGLRFFDLRYCHDWEFLLALAGHGRLGLIEQPLVRYRIHGENTIREGAEASRGRGVMRFEILWLLARHAAPLSRRLGQRLDLDPARVEAALWRSLPRFGCESLLAQLLVWRGGEPMVPASYDRLLDPQHPFRESAIVSLAEAEP